MLNIWFFLFLFLDVIFYVIFIDILLSWLTLVWINFKPKIIWDIVDPIYSFINGIIPTTVWPFRFDAFIAIILIYFLQGLLLMFFPWLESHIINLYNSYI